MEPYKSKFSEEALPSNVKLANPGAPAAGNLKDAAKENLGGKAAEADLSSTPSKLFKTLVGKTVFSPKNGVMLIVGENSIKIGNVKTNKVLAELAFDDLKFRK